MRTSRYLLATVKETPADAEIASHKLMLRAGMIRKLTSGIYTWLPLGLRVLTKVAAIVRQEMNRIDGIEILMPAIQPIELWQETGRWEKYGPLLLKIKDRHERDFCYGPTHEEVITDLVRREIQSYKQLPLTLYQIQAKFRDEIRPRFGVMRAREFLMKDAYSFHINEASLAKTYQDMYDAYCRILTRLQLKFRPVLADSGEIGGSLSHEFQVLADSGEDLIAYSDSSDYAANIEQAEALAPTTKRQPSANKMELIDTPGLYTIDALCKAFNFDSKKTVKTLLVEAEKGGAIALVLRGDHSLNTVKAEKLSHIAKPLRMLDNEKFKTLAGCNPGSIGVVACKLPIIVDRAAAELVDFTCGANIDDKHYINVNWERDVPLPLVADLRNVEAGDLSPDGQGQLLMTRGIEVGHIFQLGTKYSEVMGAQVLDENGKKVTLTMGCYGVGVSRIVAAAIEQNHDERGICWTDAMAPFQVALVPVGYHKSEKVRALADNLYQALQAAGLEVLFDDRKESPGVLFADMDLIGIPHRLVISERGIEAGTVEYKARCSSDIEHIPLASAVSFLQAKLV